VVRQWAAISFGEGHAAGVSGEGEVFTWGKNDLGQVGQSVGHDKDVPTKMEILKGWDVRALACGAHHTVALTPEDVISWGANSEGQCGQGERAETLWVKPRSIKPLQGMYVSQVVCGKYHTLCVTATSQVQSEADLPASIHMDHKDANLQQTVFQTSSSVACFACLMPFSIVRLTQVYTAKVTAVVLAPPFPGQIGKQQNALLETHL
jgi:alpha-tubulin suppressor-like RCC1 family protein